MTQAVKGGKGLNLNNASAEDLDKVGGIGKERANAIVKYRNEHGPFKSWNDVNKIPGFSKTLVDDMKDQGFQIQ